MKKRLVRNILVLGVLAWMFAFAGCGKTDAKGDTKTDAQKDTTADSQAAATTGGETADADGPDDEHAKILKAGVLKVGVEGTYPPITYHDEDGNLTGFDVEIARAIGEKLGVEVEFTEAEWDSLLAAVDSGRIDTVINAVSVTESRKEKYDFTEPYVSLYRHIIVKKDNDELTSKEDMKGKKCANNITTASADLIEEMGAEIVPIDTMQQALELIVTGRADFTILGDMQFYPYLKEHPDADLKIAFTVYDNVDQFAIPFRKGETRLVDAVNQAMNELKADGTLTGLSEKYFDSDFIEKSSIQ